MATSPALPALGFRFVPKQLLWLFPVLVAMVTAHPAAAQATAYTASHPMRLESFVTFTHESTDHNYTTSQSPVDYGYQVGADLDVAAHLWVHPGLEIRGTRATGDAANYTTLGGGPRVIASLGRFQPYAEFLMSEGRIAFNHPSDQSYNHDYSTVYNLGGGVDVALRPGWAFKADVLDQRWRLSKYNAPFHPLLVSFGVQYEVHGSRRGPR